MFYSTVVCDCDSVVRVCDSFGYWIYSVQIDVDGIEDVCRRNERSRERKKEHAAYRHEKADNITYELNRIGKPRCKAVFDREVGVQVDAISLIVDAADITIRTPSGVAVKVEMLAFWKT